MSSLSESLRKIIEKKAIEIEGKARKLASNRVPWSTKSLMQEGIITIAYRDKDNFIIKLAISDMVHPFATRGELYSDIAIKLEHFNLKRSQDALGGKNPAGSTTEGWFSQFRNDLKKEMMI